MKAPATYFEWKEISEKFSKGEDSLIPLMNEGAVTLDAGTAERFMMLFEETYKKRKQLWMDKFKNVSQNHNIRAASDFTVVVAQAKNSLKSLILYTELKPFNNDLKKVLKDDLKSFIEEVKKSLKENAMKDRTNQMNTLLLAFNNLEVEKVSAPAPAPQQENFIPNKKKIIF